MNALLKYTGMGGWRLDDERGFLEATDAAFRYGTDHHILHRPLPVQRDYAQHVARAICAGRAAPARPFIATQADVDRGTAQCGGSQSVGLHTPGAIGAQVLLDAETGTGKTLGYLIPLLLEAVRVHGTARVAVSTYTIALQKQILDGDLPRALDAVAGLTGYRPSVALRVGMGNFVDPERAGDCLDALDAREPWPNKEQRRLRADLRAWLEAALRDPGATGLLAEFSEAHAGQWPVGAEPARLRVTADSRPAPRTGAPGAQPDPAVHYGRMFYDHSRAAADTADVIITNHATVLWDTLRHGALLGGGDLPITAIVFDEADQLEAAAAGINSGSVSLEGLRGNLAEVQEFIAAHPGLLGKTAPDAVLGPLVKAATRLAEAANALGATADTIDRNNPDPHETIVMLDHPGLPDTQVAELIASAVLVAAKAGPLHAYARKAAATGEVPAAIADAVARIADIREYGRIAGERIGFDTATIGEHRRRSAVVTSATPLLAVRWSPRQHRPSLHWEHLYPARLLSRRWLLPRADAGLPPPTLRSAIFTSATLAVHAVHESSGKDLFRQFRGALGLLDPRNPGDGISSTFAPAQFGTAAFLYADAYAPAVMLKEADAVSDDDDRWTEINPKWVAYAVAMILHAREQRPGQRTLVLAASFRLSKALASALIKAGCAHVTLRLPGTSPKAKVYTNAILADPERIYIAAGCWEGFELKEGPEGHRHNAFGIVVAPQLPFPPPDRVYEHGLARVLVAHGREASLARGIAIRNAFDYAQRRLRQGFGRGIRGADDSTCFVVCDPRFPAPGSLQREASQKPVYADLMAAIPGRFRGAGGELTIDTIESGEVFRYHPAPKRRRTPA